MPRHLLNARGVPLSDGARPQDIAFGLLRVIRLNAESHQTLTDIFILIGILRPQRFSEGIPQLLENDDEFLRRHVFLVRFFADPLEDIGKR